MDWENINKIRFHGAESMKHFIVKAMVSRIMYDRKYYIYTERRFILFSDKKGGRIADVYCTKMPSKNNKIIIEVENRPTKKHTQEIVEFYNEIGDLIIVDLRKISNDIVKMEKELREILP